MTDGVSGEELNGKRALRRFTLPHICACGATGTVTFEPRGLPAPGEADPHPTIVSAEGAFQIDDGNVLICIDCAERSDRLAP